MGNRIKELRLEKGISQDKLAKAIGVTRQAISLFEKGRRDPKLETWQYMSAYFNVPVSYLKGISDSKSYFTDDEIHADNEKYNKHWENIFKIFRTAYREKNTSEERFKELQNEISSEFSLIEKEKNEWQKTLRERMEKDLNINLGNQQSNNDTKNKD